MSQIEYLIDSDSAIFCRSIFIIGCNVNSGFNRNYHISFKSII